MFTIGQITTTHMQWTVGEFTYAYCRIARAARKRDYLVTHVTKEEFRLYLPPKDIDLALKFSDPVPVRLFVHHGMGLRPEDMTESGFDAVARAIMHDAMAEVAARCPRNASCLCTLEPHGQAYRCGAVFRTEFEIEGIISKQ